MKVIGQSFQIMEPFASYEGMLRHIELCGRVSYKSEDKITNNSAEKFVNTLIANGHTSVLEHGTVYIPKEYVDTFTPYDSLRMIGTTPYVITNFRRVVNSNLKDKKEYFEFYNGDRITVKFITNRAVANEFVRHRIFSFTQESTRYCNYYREKFGSQLTLIRPHWFSQDYTGESVNGLTMEEARWDKIMYEIEFNYNWLIKHGARSQDIRGILPLDLKTELIMTGTISQWKQFFALRSASNAHPQAKELSDALRDEFEYLGLSVDTTSPFEEDKK